VQTAASSLLVTASAALVLCGCGTAEDLTTSISPPPQSRATSGEPQAQSVTVTPHQHAYLDALAVAGVYRSSDLTALSIGSYVCQARAAGQGDQAVWDFVYPLVRGDIHDSERADIAQPTMSARDATAQYIRIASERLC